jgi:hypothetical protein
VPNVARPDRERTIVMAFRLPASLVHELRIVMLDPRTGRPRYRTFGRTMERILRDYIDAQKVTPP